MAVREPIRKVSARKDTVQQTEYLKAKAHQYKSRVKMPRLLSVITVSVLY